MALVYLTGGHVISVQESAAEASERVMLPGLVFKLTISDGRPCFFPDPRAIVAIHDRQGEG